MKGKIYYLSTCSTCARILKEIDAAGHGFELQDIKTNKITPAQLDDMKEMKGSYEGLFSRRSLKYKELGLKDKVLTEKDYRKLILQEYTFLLRPVIIWKGQIYVGSAKGQIEPLKEELARSKGKGLGKG